MLLIVHILMKKNYDMYEVKQYLLLKEGFGVILQKLSRVAILLDIVARVRIFNYC